MLFLVLMLGGVCLGRVLNRFCDVTSSLFGQNAHDAFLGSEQNRLYLFPTQNIVGNSCSEMLNH